MGARTLLVTGPIDGAERYAEAARGVGWKAIVHPLLEIRPLAVDLAAEFGSLAATAPDWICVTSRNAIDVVERAAHGLRDVPCATVGAASASRLRSAGYDVRIGNATSAADLAARLFPHLSNASVVLWPRGSRSNDLSSALAATGARVLDPVVYETLDRTGGIVPPADTIFFASPSAVGAWVARAGTHRPTSTIAIGATTAEAIGRQADTLPAPLVLAEPSPIALATRLEETGPTE